MGLIFEETLPWLWVFLVKKFALLSALEVLLLWKIVNLNKARISCSRFKLQMVARQSVLGPLGKFSGKEGTH